MSGLTLELGMNSPLKRVVVSIHFHERSGPPFESCGENETSFIRSSWEAFRSPSRHVLGRRS